MRCFLEIKFADIRLISLEHVTYIHCIHMYSHGYMHICICTDLYIHIYTYVQSWIHTYIHIYRHIYTHTCIHTYTYIHTYIHTHITHTHTLLIVKWEWQGKMMSHELPIVVVSVTELTWRTLKVLSTSTWPPRVTLRVTRRCCNCELSYFQSNMALSGSTLTLSTTSSVTDMEQ